MIPMRALSILVLGSCGCGVEVGEEVVAQESEELFADVNLLAMPSGDSSTTRITFCWQNSARSYSSDRAAVEAVVDDQWHANSNINFTWQRSWDTGGCSVGAIPVRNIDVVPNASPLSMEFNFIDQGTYSNTKNCNGGWPLCRDSVAVHEVGHVLGFAHEHQGVSIGCGPAETSGTSITGDLRLGVPDADSVMGNCNTGTSDLSAGDIRGLQAVYGGGGAIQGFNLVVIRATNKQYWKQEGSGSATLTNDFTLASQFQVKTAARDVGNLGYGRVLSLQRGNMYMCGKKGFTCPPGTPVCTGTTAPRSLWQSTYDANSCLWTVVRSSSANTGGTVVDVNDPLRLYMKLEATGPTEVTFEETTAPIRFLKDI
jgi:hypothetical protein